MDIIDEKEINLRLKNKLNIKIFDEISSTNTYLKENPSSDKDVIIANMQTKGRGRIGKSFYSPSGSGIYMSIILKNKFEKEKLSLITPLAAVCMCKSIENTLGIDTKIKWVNDIFVANKKVCGILTESSIDYNTGLSNYVILGVGINIYKPKNGFTSDIKDSATYLLEKEQNGVKNEIIASFFNNLFGYINFENDFFDEYKKRCFILGKKICVIKNGKEINATAKDLNKDFNLLVQYDDKSEEFLSSGEISIKINR